MSLDWPLELAKKLRSRGSKTILNCCEVMLARRSAMSGAFWLSRSVAMLCYLAVSCWLLLRALACANQNCQGQRQVVL